MGRKHVRRIRPDPPLPEKMISHNAGTLLKTLNEFGDNHRVQYSNLSDIVRK